MICSGPRFARLGRLLRLPQLVTSQPRDKFLVFALWTLCASCHACTRPGRPCDKFPPLVWPLVRCYNSSWGHGFRDELHVN